MPKTSKKTPGADEIAEMASRGEDISGYFTNNFKVVRPVHRVNVDLTRGMLNDLDERAARLNISRQAVIKTLLARALNEERDHKGRVRAPKTGMNIFAWAGTGVWSTESVGMKQRCRKLYGQGDSSTDCFDNQLSIQYCPCIGSGHGSYGHRASSHFVRNEAAKPSGPGNSVARLMFIF